jgi:hypothetical protein
MLMEAREVPMPHTKTFGSMDTMRLSAFLFAMSLACAAGAADDWKEYESPDHSFTVHFPIDPKIEATAYRTDGHSFDAQVYSAAQDTGTFTLTVPQVPETGLQTQEDTLINSMARPATSP